MSGVLDKILYIIYGVIIIALLIRVVIFLTFKLLLFWKIWKNNTIVEEEHGYLYDYIKWENRDIQKVSSVRFSLDCHNIGFRLRLKNKIK
jgi:hypothetical protein